MPLLEIHGLEAHYGDTQVLHDVSLSVDDGDLLALLGPFGAGKTTLLRAISGTVRSSGEVTFEGERLFRRTPEGMARRHVVHLPAGGGTFARLSVLDNLRLGAWTQRGLSARDLAHVYEQFPVLYERRADRAGSLSDAEQQVLALGRALMGKPRLLLADEPSGGLAPHDAAAVAAGLRALRERGATVVVAEERAELVPDATQTVVLEAGRVAGGS